MTLRIVFRRPARREFDDAADRHDEQRPDLGEEFIVEIDQAVGQSGQGQQSQAQGSLSTELHGDPAQSR